MTMINNLFLIRNKQEYDAANKTIETGRLNDFSMLSWSEKKPYMTNSCSHFKNVMKWEDFQVEDVTLNPYWFENYKQIEVIVRERTKRFCQNEIARSPHFMFGLVWKLGDEYYKYIDVLNRFFKDYRPAVIYFSYERSFISDLILSFMKLYGVGYKDLRSRAA